MVQSYLAKLNPVQFQEKFVFKSHPSLKSHVIMKQNTVQGKRGPPAVNEFCFTPERKSSLGQWPHNHEDLPLGAIESIYNPSPGAWGQRD